MTQARGSPGRQAQEMSKFWAPVHRPEGSPPQDTSLPVACKAELSHLNFPFWSSAF